MSSILFGDTMVPNIEYGYILLLGYSILYKEYCLTGFNHQKNATHACSEATPGTDLARISVPTSVVGGLKISRSQEFHSC